MHQNIQCLRNKIEELEIFLSEQEAKTDILCLTEHWLRQEQKDFYKLDGYTMMSCYARESMQHGGACIFVSEKLDFEPAKDIENKSIEGEIECSCILSKSKKIILLCIYRTNLGNLNVFLKSLEDILSYVQGKFKFYKIILCGDFNINLLENSQNRNQFIDLLLTFNLIQTIYQPTRVTKQTATLLDNFFVNFNYAKSQVVESAL